MKEVIVISSLWTVLFVCCVLVSEGPPGSEYFQPVRPLAKRERKKSFQAEPGKQTRKLFGLHEERAEETDVRGEMTTFI